MAAAVLVAEKFIAENGYTDLPFEQLKERPDRERIEWSADRSQMLKLRRNTLRPHAIGAKFYGDAENPSWNIAFDFTESATDERQTCRVITMQFDGTHIRMNHKDGIRSYFLGFQSQ